MSEAPLTEADLEALRALDTPTVCNAMEVVAPERRGYGYTTEPLFCAFPDLPPIVGYACTATIRAMRPSGLSEAAARDLRLAYYEYTHDAPGPKITVIQDLDGGQAGYGAFWGEVNSTVHKTLGSLGVITDGCIRDLHMIAPGFQMLAGSVKPSHAHVHIVDFGKQVHVAGMTVEHGDLIHADRHGAIVIPAALARRIPEAAAQVAAKEKVILDVCRAPDFTFAKLRAAMGGPKDIH